METKEDKFEFIIDHLSTSFDKDMRESIEELLFGEGIIEEIDDNTCFIIDSIMAQVGTRIKETYNKNMS